MSIYIITTFVNRYIMHRSAYHLGVGRVEQFVFLEQVAIAKSGVALQAPVLAGHRNCGRRRRRLRRRRPGTASAVQVFL